MFLSVSALWVASMVFDKLKNHSCTENTSIIRTYVEKLEFTEMGSAIDTNF